MAKLIRNFIRDESGAAAIEYALVVSLSSLVCITVLPTLGGSLQQIFGKVQMALEEATQSINLR